MTDTTDRTWNRRVVQYRDGGCGVHEVHYRDGEIIGWRAEPSEAVHGDAAELRAAIMATMEQSMRALGEPGLVESDLPGDGRSAE